MVGCQMPPKPLLSLPHQQEGRESKMKKLMGQDKHREIAHQLPPWAKQTQLKEDSFKLLPTKNRVG